MSLRVGYVISYVGFLAILITMSADMGVSIVNVNQETILTPPNPPPDLNLFSSLTFVFEMAVFGITTFAFLATTTTEFLFLSIFLILPLTAGFIWALVELARGN